MTSKKTVPLNNVLPLKIADSAKGIRHVFIRDYVTEAYIGAYSHETEGKQKIRVNVDLSVAETQEQHGDELANVVCYDQVISGIRKLLNAGHINLVETWPGIRNSRRPQNSGALRVGPPHDSQIPSPPEGADCRKYH